MTFGGGMKIEYGAPGSVGSAWKHAPPCQRSHAYRSASAGV